MSWDRRPIYRLVCSAGDIATRKDEDIMFSVQIKRWWSGWDVVTFAHGTDRATLAAWRHANPSPDHVVILGPLKGEPKPSVQP
jgi:hypothetical protein